MTRSLLLRIAAALSLITATGHTIGAGSDAPSAPRRATWTSSTATTFEPEPEPPGSTRGTIAYGSARSYLVDSAPCDAFPGAFLPVLSAAVGLAF